MVECSKCKKMNNDDVKFCTECGCAIETKHCRGQDSIQQKQAGNKKIIAITIYVVVFLLLFIIGLFIFALELSNSNENNDSNKIIPVIEDVIVL